MRLHIGHALRATLLALLLTPALATASSSSSGSGNEKKKETPVKPCTIRSPASGLFFDLNTISVQVPKEGIGKKKDDKTKAESWHAKGYDYGANFTLNFCAPVVEELDSVQGVDKSLWRNVSAFYNQGGKTYSIGQQNSELVFRGSKLVLNYTHGSPCDDSHTSRARAIYNYNTLDPKIKATSSKERKKSTIISLLCQKDALPASPKVTLAFVGASEDKCTYFFEARSPSACAGIETTPSQLSPGGVFGVIFLITVLVYLGGGCVYQRTVMHQRGWRQLPNYSMWSSVWGFFSDIVVILTSSCMRFLPGRRGYSPLSLGGNGNVRGRNSEDENRLIDNLEEEWDD